MTEATAASASADPWAARLRPLGVILEKVSSVVERLVGRRGVSLGLLVVTAWFGVAGWIRPPISADLGGLRIPLLASVPESLPPTHPAYVRGPILILSFGTLLVGTSALGAILVLIRVRWFRFAAGLVLCAWFAGLAGVVFNHPEWLGQLQRQDEQRRAVISVLTGTAHPPVVITSYPRVETTPLTSGADALLGLLGYIPKERMVLWLPVTVAVLLAHRGPLYRRLGWLALWCLLGTLAAGGLAWNRLGAEYAWLQAVAAENRGEFEEGEHYAQAALARFPALARVQRTWELLGRLDYRQGRTTPAARYFLATQWGRNGDDRQAIAELESLYQQGPPGPPIGDWLADALVQRGMNLFDQGHLAAAEEQWGRALEVAPSQVYLGLYLAALRAPVERRDPERVTVMVDPLLVGMADRALRAAFQAMVGDCYFECGQFVEARDRYRESLNAYSLPKQINYRGLRGLLGM